jgi:hypothetical protein
MEFIRIRSKDRLKEQLDALGTRLGAFWNFDEAELMVSYKQYVDPRSKAQNALAWMWFTQMADYYSRRLKQMSKDDMHDLMCHHFLGYEDRVIGNTVLEHQLIGTSGLDKSDMSEFMYKVEQWNTNNGLLLTIPADNEYMKYKEARN